MFFLRKRLRALALDSAEREALHAAVLEAGGCGTRRPARGQGRDFYWLGTSSTGPGLITTAGAQLRAAILADGALAGAPSNYSLTAWEKR